jgi:hypothetical protein
VLPLLGIVSLTGLIFLGGQVTSIMSSVGTTI